MCDPSFNMTSNIISSLLIYSKFIDRATKTVNKIATAINVIGELYLVES